MSDTFNDLPPTYYDDGVRYGTGPEMIAEIRALRAQQRDLLQAKSDLKAEIYALKTALAPFAGFGKRYIDSRGDRIKPGEKISLSWDIEDFRRALRAYTGNYDES